MSKFIECSQESYNGAINEAINIEKVAWVVKKDTKDVDDPSIGIYHIVFSEKFQVPNPGDGFYWNYNLEIMRDSDYEMIVKNQYSKKNNIFVPCVDKAERCSHKADLSNDSLIIIDLIENVKRQELYYSCPQDGDIITYQLQIDRINLSSIVFHYPLEIQRDSDYHLLLKYINER